MVLVNTCVYTGTKKREFHNPPTSSWIRTTDNEVRGTATYLFTYSGSSITIYQIDMYLQDFPSEGVRNDWTKVMRKKAVTRVAKNT